MYSAYQYSPMQGSSRRRKGAKPKPRTKRGPPHIPDPNIGNEVGVPLHICANGQTGCVKCRMPGGSHNAVWTSDGDVSIPHRRMNVCGATEYRGSNPPRELIGRLHGFDYTLQMSNLPQDPSSWLFMGQRLTALIEPMANHSVGISTLTTDPSRPDRVTMTRANMAGAGYIVEWILQGAAGHPDVGRWGWYRYPDGSVRVWSWKTYEETPPCLVAWKHAHDWHWHLQENLGEMGIHLRYATILAVVGIIVVSGQGQTLLWP
ncbi:hypothetical protein B0H11DRAFT_1953799 [Mycena galericulata]|nr:hypothetical protein B0H11DRAFT_1953799 [Mycena galericulata]